MDPGKIHQRKRSSAESKVFSCEVLFISGAVAASAAVRGDEGQGI